MLCPMETLLLIGRMFRLVSKQLEFYRAILIARVMTPGPPTGSLWRPDLGDVIQSGWLVLNLNLVLFPVGLPRSIGRL